MNENVELLEYIYQNCDMGVTSLTNLIKEINNKDNKIKKLVEEKIKGYEKFVKKSEELLNKYNTDPKNPNFIAEVSSWMGIKMEMMKDNSDSRIADMIIQGFTMGTVEIEKKIKNYKNEADKDILKLAENLLEFSKNSIEDLKKFL